MKREFTFSYAGKNHRGMRVLSILCSCGWIHLTAYRWMKKGDAKGYLINRFNDHPCIQSESLD